MLTTHVDELAVDEQDRGIPPGQRLVEVLNERGMSQAELARRTGLSTKHVNQIVGGYAAISADTALKLERVTQVPAQRWTRLEADYQVQLSRQIEAVEFEADIDWLSALPVAELVRRGFIRRRPLPVDQLREVLAFFGVANRRAWSSIWDVPTAYRKSRAFESSLPSLAAWLRIGEVRVMDLACQPFDRARFRMALVEVRGLTQVADPQVWLPRLIDLCSQAGVAIVVEREITGARINGVVRWVGHDRPLIQLSARHRWADIFWFTFFHEAGHLLLHDRRKLTFVDAGKGEDRIEKEADEFAARTIIPREAAAHLPPLRTAQEVRAFAEEIGVGPGLVVGRLQHDGRFRHNEFNDLRTLLSFGDEQQSGAVHQNRSDESGYVAQLLSTQNLPDPPEKP